MAFDWVTARSECSPAAILRQIYVGCKADIDIMDAKLRKVIVDAGGGQAPAFKVDDYTSRFVVTKRLGSNLAGSVEFSITGSAIAVEAKAEGAENTSLLATVDLNRDGKCVLIMDGREIEMWQLRRAALHGLFFGD